MATSDLQEKKRIVVIAGPTAVGKTAAGIFLAGMIGGEIVSCDSMQVYREITVASGKPSVREMQAVAHHLIGDIPVEENFDAASFQRAALKAVDGIFGRKKIPVIVGGTGMYLKVLLDGIFTEAGSSDHARQEILQEAQTEAGRLRLYEELCSGDPEAAARIHPNDIRRITRALEVLRLSGHPISGLQKTTQGLWNQHRVVCFGLTMERSCLYTRISRRVDGMFADGLVEEIRVLQGMRLGRTAGALIGLKEVGAYLSGEVTLEEAKAQMLKNTRRLAKRQLTWFRAEKRLRWIDIREQDSPGDIARRIVEILNGEECWIRDA